MRYEDLKIGRRVKFVHWLNPCPMLHGAITEFDDKTARVYVEDAKNFNPINGKSRSFGMKIGRIEEDAEAEAEYNGISSFLSNVYNKEEQKK